MGVTIPDQTAAEGDADGGADGGGLGRAVGDDDVGGPVLPVGNSYGGMVVTEAASGNDAIVALVHGGAFCPEPGSPP